VQRRVRRLVVRRQPDPASGGVRLDHGPPAVVEAAQSGEQRLRPAEEPQQRHP